MVVVVGTPDVVVVVVVGDPVVVVVVVLPFNGKVIQFKLSP